MLNKGLKYLLDEDPTKTLTKRGVEVRKKLRPLLIFLLKISNKQKLTIEKIEFDPSLETRPLVYVCSHGFKDDCQNMLVTAKPEGFMLFGNIDLFLNTFDGTLAWLYGSQLVDRYDKTSRHISKARMDRIFELGGNLIIFPEATWNLSPNKPMLGLHWGFYEEAIKNNAVIVPVMTHKTGDKCYSRVLHSIDPKEVWKDDIDLIYHKMRQYLDKARDIMMYKSDESEAFNDCFVSLDELVTRYGALVDEALIYREREEVKSARLLDAVHQEMDAVLSRIELLADRYRQILKELTFKDDDSIETSAYKLITKLISRVGSARKEVVVKYVRDTMALEKYDMIEKHPDNSFMDESADMYEAWDKYIEETLAATPYFYPEPESTCEFRDPLVEEIDEVMPWLKDKQKNLK